MARQYSHTQFFRRVPNALLGHYFQKRRNVLQEIAFDELKEREVEPIFRAFTNLPPEQQAEIEAELQDIDNMASQGGEPASRRDHQGMGYTATHRATTGRDRTGHEFAQ